RRGAGTGAARRSQPRAAAMPRIKGAKFSSEGERGTARLSYFEVPLLVRLSRREGKVRPYVLGGPVLSFRTSATAEALGVSESVEDQVRRTDFGVALGAGMRMPAGRGFFLLEAHYAFGLRNINIPAPGDAPLDVKNRALQLQMGLI